MSEPSAAACRPRIELRNLDIPKKLLVATILATVGFGYLGALANLFASHSGNDSHQTVTLAEFGKVWKEEGAAALFEKINQSLGKEDVIKHYHGTGAGVTRMETGLKGVMTKILLEERGSDDIPKEDTQKEIDDLIKPIIEWSKQPRYLREIAYHEGVPVKETKDTLEPDFAKLAEIFPETKEANSNDKRGKGKASKATLDLPEGVVLEKLIKETFENDCVSCHSGSGSAHHHLMTTFAEIDSYCVEDHGVSYAYLARTTHVHLLGFSVLFAMTGFLFSLTSYPVILRTIFVPWTLFFQIIEIACWWLAKRDVIYAEAIYYLGPVIGLGLAFQLVGTFVDLVVRRPDAPTSP